MCFTKFFKLFLSTRFSARSKGMFNSYTIYFYLKNYEAKQITKELCNFVFSQAAVRSAGAKLVYME